MKQFNWEGINLDKCILVKWIKKSIQKQKNLYKSRTLSKCINQKKAFEIKMQNNSLSVAQNSPSFLLFLSGIRTFSKEYIVPVCVVITFLNNAIILLVLYRSKAVQQSILVSVRLYYLAFAWSDIFATICYHLYRYVRM